MDLPKIKNEDLPEELKELLGDEDAEFEAIVDPMDVIDIQLDPDAYYEGRLQTAPARQPRHHRPRRRAPATASVGCGARPANAEDRPSARQPAERRARGGLRSAAATDRCPDASEPSDILCGTVRRKRCLCSRLARAEGPGGCLGRTHDSGDSGRSDVS